MNPLAIGLVLVLGGDALTGVTLQGLGLRAPADWQRTQPDEATLEFAPPDDAARLAVSVYPLERFISPAACVKKLVDAVGKDGFTPLTLGAQPAAKKVTHDYVGEGEAAKTEANKVTTTTVLGCNGKVKWVLTWTARTAQAPRFGPMLKRVLDSVSYPRIVP
jgi:hypothetical protein